MVIANRASSVSRSVPPPVKGWSTFHSVADMPADMAVVLDNWFPETEKIRLRPDHTSHATGLGGPVETLLPYNALDGTTKLFGAANGNIFDVTSG